MKRRRNLLIVQLHDSLLKITYSTVDQLGAAAAGPRREIASLYQGSFEV